MIGRIVRRPFGDAAGRKGWLGPFAHAQPHVVYHYALTLLGWPRFERPFRIVLLSDHHVGSHTGDVARHRNLMAAAQAVGVRRVVAQSIAFIYAEGPRPHREGDPLDASEAQGTTIAGVARLEDAVLRTPGIDGIVLRYGRLYGPGTWFGRPGGPGPLTADAATHAALWAVTRGAP